MVQLIEQFQSANGARDTDWLRQQRQFALNRQAQDRKEKLEDKQSDDLAAVGVDLVMATDVQIRAFEKKLDGYETMTVEALIENQKQLEAVQARIATMLEQAYMLEDGRRVFKTEDGTQVFDEFGEEVSPEDVDFELIGEDRPTWEAFSVEHNELQRLEGERAELHEFQERLDEAHDEIDGGEISEADLDELDAELADLMPPSINPNTNGLEKIASTSGLATTKTATNSAVQTPNAGVDTPAL